MFTSAGHLTHRESLLIRHGQNQECFTCLIEILEDANISMVQREMCLSFLKSVVDENETFLQVLPSYRLECCNIICVLTDMYTEDPHKLTAALLCASMIDKLQDEHLYEIFMDKFQDVVLSRLVEKHSQFYFIVLSKLCEFSKTYSQMIVSFHGNIILTVLEAHHCFDEDTLSWLVSLLKLLIPILCSNCGLLKEGSDLFLWKILEVLVVWMNTVHSSELQVNILFLLRECLQSEEMISGLLLIGSEGSVDCSLLMGLKRILASKNSMIIVPGTQCLTLLMEKLTEPALVKEVLDTDLAEIVFEFLHSTIPSQLESTFQCLQAMVQHQYFFEKCHAVYGLDSILKSIKDALDTGKTIILIKGLELLTSLLVRQPESMPLFMNQSWNFCITLLHTAVQYETPAVFVKALKAVEQFMRPQHQQTPLAVRSITSLLSTVYYYYEHHLKSLTQSGQGQQAYHMTSSIINIVVSTYR
ncbi:meiosis inhibitor protein 1-like [Physella acuta]|uniref:meiosis inhibitor protein 1-like n=1 Tax=Physella acuta TaxID=109671 RepID=UPI0027DABE96|nr:meiosis inhibitor protein 1-like [Physella acuta]